MIREFSSLHNHTHFSFYDAISLPSELVSAAKNKGLISIAVTEHGSCHSHADIYLEGKKQGVKTILGVEAYVIHDLEEWRRLKEKIDVDRKARGKDESDNADYDEEMYSNSKQLRRKGHLVLLACNREGLSNVYRLTYEAHKFGFYGKPRMDKKMLLSHSSGIVASSACMGGVISNKCWEFQKGDASWEEVVREALDYDQIFGRGRFFLELQMNESEGQKYINDCLVKIHNETGIPLSITTDSHYINKDDWETQEVLYMMRAKTSLTTRKNWSFGIKQLYIKSPEEMWDSFLRYGGKLDERVAIEAFQNTLLIDSMIEEFEPDSHQRLPTLKDVDNPLQKMGELVIEELKRRKLDTNDRYREQLLRELKVIKDKGFAAYFLIVRHMVKEAKKEMLIGTGRGSSAGSLVCYLLGITDIDPIEHNLMFERFLDPSRAELPDIDVDFQDVDRAKDMLRKLFGEDNVACISSYGTHQIKGLLKDLGRVYDIDHNDINKVNKKIDSELRVLHTAGTDKSTLVVTLEDLERVSPSYNDFVRKHSELGKFIKKLYWKNSHVTRHASGVIIGDDLPAETSIFKSKGIVQASFTDGIINKNLSSMGFVKFDILSIATLKIIDYAMKLISVRTGKPHDEIKESLRPHNMDMNDMKVMKHIFWDGNFAGIFQFTNKGIRRLAMKIKPDCFNDISAICSLYRPGPLHAGMDDLYAGNKQAAIDGTLEYDHPILKEILSETYGTLIYQEQLMMACHKFAGMSMEDTNKVRKLLLKKTKDADKKREEDTKKFGEMFVDGVVKNAGMPEQYAKKLWEDFKGWSSYGFNAAHSKSYSVMTMQCAHLATYYPLEFYSAVLTVGQAGEMQEYVCDIQKAGIKVLPVDINKSKHANVIEGDTIRLSLSSVLGVGPAAIEKIVANQPYASFLDYIDRSGVGKTATAPLILVGAFDSLEDNMKLLEQKYELCCVTPKLKTKKLRPELLTKWNELKVKDYEPHEKIFLENSLLGFSIKGSPFEVLDREKKISMMFDGLVIEHKDFIEGDSEEAMLPVVVKEFRERAQRNGQMMAFIKFGVQSGEEFDSPCFSSVWRWISGKIRNGKVYVATFNRRLDDPQNLIVGRKGFAQSEQSALSALIDVDEVEL